MLNIRDKIKIKIHGIANGGEGVARYNNIVVFVPYAAIGDELLVEITESKKNYARGKIREIIKASPDRIQPECKFYFNTKDNYDQWCGGCNFMHLEYGKQLQYKENLVKSAFQKLAGLSEDDYIWDGISSNPRVWGYRNKLQIPISKDRNGQPCAGFFMPRTHNVMKIDNCAVEPTILSTIVDAVLKLLAEYELSIYDENTRYMGIRHLVIRINKANDIILTIVSAKKIEEKIYKIADLLSNYFSNIKGILYNYNPKRTNVILGEEFIILTGEDKLTEQIGDISYQISPSSFFQVNSYQVYNLYEGVKAYLSPKGDEYILDLYCGAGGISLYLAPSVRCVTGVESVKSAVDNAIENVDKNDIFNAMYHNAKIENIIRKFTKNSEFDTIIFNPPRKGIDKKVFSYIPSLKFKKIIYVSCNPVTLARDLKLFKDFGFNLKRARAYDMFSQTSQVETVALIETNSS
ncbi:23S rRNA (uracil(1939)-C(5))-methyltransferase RlmD [bacterium]